jgi:hypothetical protein
MTDYFVRSLVVDPLTYTPSSRSTGIALRMIYEFWGYCINGTTSLTSPGGMPTTPTAGPTNGFEGTTVLATGSDGATIAGTDTLDSAGASFSVASHLNKHIVIWKPSDPTSENSIYQIIGVPSSTQLRLLVANGGTPDVVTLKPAFTSRSSLRYRIIDLATVGGLAWTATTHYVVLQFTPTLINAGQASSQVQFQVGTAVTRINMILSPGGTWTGSAFTDGSTAITPVTNGSGMFNSASGTYCLFTMIADENSLILHISGFGMTPGTTGGMYVEIPKRLYTLAQDPNPIACCAWGVSSINVTSATADLGGYWWMRCPDTVTRNHRALTRSVLGMGTDATLNEGFGFNNNLSGDLGFNYPRGLTLTSPVLLGHHTTAGQFTLARGQLRRIRMSTTALPNYKRIGTNGEWLHLNSSILFPWDNTILPFNLMALGF